MKSKRLEITDRDGRVSAYVELKLNEKEINGNKVKDISITVNGKTATTTEIDRFLALLDAVYFGTLNDNEVIETQNGMYIVFFKGKDRYGIRVGDKADREAIFLKRVAFRELFYWILTQLRN